MNKTQYKKLMKYEQSLAEAKSGYYRALLSAEVEELNEIYTELGYPFSKSNKTCSRCILTMLLNLAKEADLYYTKSEAKANKKSNKNNEQEV